MVIGIGHDLVDQRRIKKNLDRFGSRFVMRICTTDEQDEFKTHHNQIAYLSGRFAVKESVYKALSRSDQSKMRWHHASIINNRAGAPILTLSGACLEQVNLCVPQGFKLDCHLSITDQPPYSSAMVVLSYCQA